MKSDVEAKLEKAVDASRLNLLAVTDRICPIAVCARNRGLAMLERNEEYVTARTAYHNAMKTLMLHHRETGRISKWEE